MFFSPARFFDRLPSVSQLMAIHHQLVFAAIFTSRRSPCTGFGPKRGRALLKTIQEVPRSDEGRAVVDGNAQALDLLLQKLAAATLKMQETTTFIPLRSGTSM
jgi:hypothetical protein